ncbi:MAG: DUF1501 domain-containing protein [Bacteroidetes bacterium]|nr:MAG: DUF1501 domain-containing protein [Bacteroidota bacterium]REK08093.1 MAG: DUF1501 domain-containing protein [Bacteroidota bacterium]REK32298.1 MAG: DUF1501 domain-containing protein [Bacteroidota bacterium]REK49532.1 MAG: DUF1501 domain-containing protein [Bacteroidota bacterium]
MKRRDFIRASVPATLLPGLINGFSFRAFAGSPLIQSLAAANVTDHVLVLIQLNGGNDGLNTVIPLDQYSNLANARSNILIPDNLVLPLSGTTVTGLHPAMGGIHQLFNDGKVGIIQSVGYPQQNYSHFRSTDIWMTASDANQVLSSGWAGRYLNYEYPNYPNGYPNPTMPDPLALQIGSSVSLALQGPAASMGMAISDPTSFYNMINGIIDPAPNTPAGKELTYIRTVAQQSQQYASVILGAANNITVQSPSYPSAGSNPLADQLKIVARLVAGGLKTRIYMVNIGGFDTHSSQADAGSTTTGTHATLLARLSEAVKAFMDDLSFLNIEDRVTGLTFSEFGRRIKSNASLGTDHGAAAPMFVFGKNVEPGILGNNPQIPVSVTTSDNLPMQFDFRSVYASILEDWFCVPSADLNNIMLNNFQKLPIIQQGLCMPTDLHQLNQDAGINLISNYPNPFNESTYITFKTSGGHALIQIFDNEGRLIKTPVDGDYPEGEHKIWFENENYRSGVYYARFQNGSVQQVRNMLITR